MSTDLQILLDKKTSSDQTSNEFTALWDKITKAEKSYERAEQKREDIVQQFNLRVKPVEEKLLSRRFDFAQHLLSFFQKKSIKDDQLEELSYWIDDIINIMMGSPFRSHLDLDGLIHDYRNLLQNRQSQTSSDDSINKENIINMLAEFGIVLDHDVYETIFAGKENDPIALEAAFQGFMHQYMSDNAAAATEDYYDKSDSYDQFSDSDEYCRDADDLQPKKDQHVSYDPQELITTLYKRLAQKLHPDKATSKEDEEHRHTVMQQLSKARKNADLFTLLSLVKSYADPSDFKISEQHLDSISNSLKQKLEALRAQRDNLKYEPTIKSQIYQQFNGRGKKAIEQKMQSYCDELEAVYFDISQQQASLTSLKSLKIALDSRRRRFFYPF